MKVLKIIYALLSGVLSLIGAFAFACIFLGAFANSPMIMGISVLVLFGSLYVKAEIVDREI